MDYKSKEIQLKNGRICLLRRPEESDAEALIEYLKITSGETPYMVREPEEVTVTLEEERDFLRKSAEDPLGLMLSAFVDGKFVGNCSFAAVSRLGKMRHRCKAGISLYREFWSLGIGTALMREVVDAARAAGFEQMELDAVSTNTPAIALYKKLGFETIGTIPCGFKFRDGTYGDLLLMVKKLL